MILNQGVKWPSHVLPLLSESVPSGHVENNKA